MKNHAKHRQLFPKTKFNWRATPLLIRYGPEEYQKILKRQDVQTDEQMVHRLLKNYCDCNAQGRPAKPWNRYSNYLKLRDGADHQTVGDLRCGLGFRGPTSGTSR
jgi:hypothetical protein